MRKVLIFGNSASGKSTLAKHLSQRAGMGHLDLDTIAWQPVDPPVRMPLAQARQSIDDFVSSHASWVIEGCYSDLLTLVQDKASEAIFMDLPIELCLANAQARPWEPHKYPSKQAQDANLGMLLGWIADYASRDDEFSQTAHQAFFQQLGIRKHRVTRNIDPDDFDAAG